MKKICFAATAAAALFASTSAMAGDGIFGGENPADIYVAPRVSTLGVGLDAGAQLNESFGLRLNGNYFGMDQDFEFDGVDYNADLNLKTAGLILDWHPLKTGFYLSGGVYWNGNEADLTATPTSDIEIGGITYTPAQAGTLSGSVKSTNDIAPYIGVGYRGNVGGGFSIGFEAGAMYTGDYDVNLTSNSPLVSAADLERERQQVEDDLNEYGIYPVVMLRAVYQF